MAGPCYISDISYLINSPNNLVKKGLIPISYKETEA